MSENTEVIQFPGSQPRFPNLSDAAQVEKVGLLEISQSLVLRVPAQHSTAPITFTLMILIL
jgi:hypothetical protein